MKRTRQGMGLLWLVVTCFLGALSARAIGPEVRDNAGLFSPSAIKDADETIRNIQKNFRKDLLIETFANIPENRKEEYDNNREKFFADFVRERAQAARLDGIYVLIMKESPPRRFRIQVGVGEVTRQRAFVPTDRDELVRLLQSSFREEKYDDGLRTAVAFVERTLRSHLQVPSSTALPNAVRGNSAPPPTAPFASPSRSSGVSPFIIVVVIVGAIFIAMFLARLLRGGMGNNVGGPRGTGGLTGGGGGFLSGMLGGLGGAVAGNWLYDQFSDRHSHSHDVHAASAPDSLPPDSLPSDIGGDYSSSGGDVGGGDFGGGGGDVGGGGGDFGGGGGDV